MNDGSMVLGQCTDVTPIYEEKLNWEKARLEERLSRVNAALDAIRKHPEVVELLNAIQKAL